MHDSADEPLAPRLDLSVVIPAYESAAYVAEAIRSVLAQEIRPVEIIVVDDGSTDATGTIAAGTSPLVTVVSKPNGGEASARNAGLRAASTEWVAFLDADDRFLPGRLTAFARRIGNEPELDVVTADAYIEVAGDIVGTCYGPQWTFPHDHHREEILRRNFVLGHVVVRRRRLLDLGGFDETISHTTDWDMWIRVLYGGGRIGFIDERLSVYRLHSASLSSNRLAMAHGALASLRSAASNPALTGPERGVVQGAIADQRMLIDQESLAEALEAGDSSVVCALARVVGRNPRQPARQRGRAAAAAVAPRAIVAVHRRKRRGRAVGATGRYVPSGPATTGRIEGTHDQPLVSVVLPFLDEARYLEGAIDTVVAQTMESWELLLVDDGSTDGSGATADAAAARSGGRLRVIRHPEGVNRGLAASRNLGLAAAAGGAIAFLDADDRWEPTKLARQVDLLASHPGAAMVAGPTWHRVEGSDAAPVRWPVSRRAPRLFAPGAFVRELARETVIMPPPPSAVMFRTAQLRDVGGVPGGDSLYEDQRTFAAVNLAHPVYLGDEEPVSTYTKRDDSLFGSLQHDVATKAAQRRTFELWLLRRGLRSGFPGLLTVAALGAHRVRVAVMRRVTRR